MIKIDNAGFGPTYWKQVTEAEYLTWLAGIANDGDLITRMSIQGGVCLFCGTVIGDNLKCPGCGHVDPPTKLPAAGVGERKDATMGGTTHDTDPAAPAEESEAVANTATDGSNTDAVGETTTEATDAPDGDSGDAAAEEE